MSTCGSAARAPPGTAARDRMKRCFSFMRLLCSGCSSVVPAGWFGGAAIIGHAHDPQFPRQDEAGVRSASAGRSADVRLRHDRVRLFPPRSRPHAGRVRCRRALPARERYGRRAMIRLHDTMTREKREFVPQDPKRITMYVCGPTVYGRAHIGNARPAVVFDTLARLIRRQFGPDSLRYARNVTDVDDKIIAAAEAEGVGYRLITERYYKHYMEDMGALGVLKPDFEPRATAFIPQMIKLIERLIAQGHAY